MEKLDDALAVVSLDLDDAVLCRAAGTTQTLKRLCNLGLFAGRQPGDRRNHAGAAPLAKHAHDTVVGHARFSIAFHARAVRQARDAAPPNDAHRMRVAIFCGAHKGSNGKYAEIAAHVARSLVSREIGIVYGGGRVGLMGVVADAALQAGGEVIGVIPRSLAGEEVAHGGVTKLHVVESMHDRKALMADLSDAFVALPGGFGTMDEFCEILTWAQLRIHAKPVAILNAEGYYDELLALFDKMVREGFVTQINRGLVRSASTVEELLLSLGRVHSERDRLSD